MAGKKLEITEEIEKKLKRKGQSVKFKFDDGLLTQLRRCQSNLNNKAVKNRTVDIGISLFSVISNRKAGYIEFVRNY